MTAAVYEHIVFDLDGTLSDSRKGIFNATVYMAEKMGLQKPDAARFTALIGPPLQEGFRTVYGLSEDRINCAVKAFREYYSERGLFENELYPGIPALLNKLVAAGCHLYVATSKLETYAREIIRHFKIDKFFTDIAGADYNGLKAGKESLILSLFQRNGIYNPDHVVLIGDSKYDIDAANAIGIDSIGVVYGFNSREDMLDYNPDYIAGDVDDLYGLLLNQ